MKIFISYGHNDHTELVNLVFDALKAEGHEPWKDDRYEGASGIASGQDFTEVIYRAIDESDFVIAFVTRATVDKPYCRDERQYAYNRKGTHFIQIRLDGVDITLGNSRSYVDMSEVISSSGVIAQRVFEERMRAILAAFRDPDSFAEGGITPWTKIDTHLKVPGSLKYGEFVADLDAADFVGRGWLLEQCKAWVRDNTVPRRLFVILGEAGTGKTAFVRHLASDAELVRSVHVCVYDRPSTRTAKDTLKDLAYVLAQNNPSYFSFLKSQNLEKIKDMSVDGLFEYLFLEPLSTEGNKYLLIIDGLDELEENSGLVPLMKLFRQYSDRINPNISFLLTTRPDEYIVDHLRKVGGGKPLGSVTLSKDACREDLMLYIERKLDELGCRSEVLAERILDACDGNFEYLSLLFKEALEEGVPVFEQMQMPRGLNERYAQYLDRRMEAKELTRLTREQRKLLAVMCASYEPIPLSLLADVADMDEDEVLDELELFGSLIRRSDDKRDPLVSVFTKSFRDFLVSMEYRRYSADVSLGTRLISEYVMEHLRCERDFAKIAYLDKNAFAHLIRYSIEDFDSVIEYMRRLEERGVDVALRIASALIRGEYDLIRAHVRIVDEMEIESSVRNHLVGGRYKEVIEPLIEYYKNNGRLAHACVLEAIMLSWDGNKGNLDKAENICAWAIEFARADYEKNPCYKTRRTLSMLLERLARIIRIGGEAERLPYALKLVKEHLDLNAESLKERECYRTLRDMGVAYTNLAVMLERMNPQDGVDLAEEWNQRALVVGVRCYALKPCSESRRDLAYSYGHLGDIAARKKTQEQLAIAEDLYRKQLALYEEDYQKNRKYNSRISLIWSLNDLATLLEDKGDEQSLAEAHALYEKQLEVAEENYRENPSYDTRFNLSLAYVKLGDVEDRMESPEIRALAEERYARQLELAEDNYRFNPCCESRRYLSIACGRVAYMEESKGTPDGAADARRLYERKLDLSTENYGSEASLENRKDLARDCALLAALIEASGSAEDLPRALELAREEYELSKVNYALDPSDDSLESLLGACDHLLGLLDRMRDGVQIAEYEAVLRCKLSTVRDLYKQDPRLANACFLAITLRELADLLVERNSREEISEAKRLYLECAESMEQIVLNIPDYANRRVLAYCYYGACRASERLDVEGELCEPMSFWERRISVDEESYRQYPSEQSLMDLRNDYAVMIEMCERKSTPESLERAGEYRKKLEESEAPRE